MGDVALACMAILFAFVLLLPTLSAASAQRRPNLVPQGWTQETADPQTKTRRFVSPDGRSWLMTKQSAANRSSLSRDMDELAHRDGEQVTYHRRGTSWIAVSGYRNNQIFYRKSNLACGGTRAGTISSCSIRAKRRGAWTPGLPRSPAV
jgi:hypothetical protein